MPVVVMQPVGQSNGSLSGGGISLCIGPLPQAGLDKTFSLAIGSWGVRFGAQVADAQFTTGRPEELGQVRIPIVGHHPLNADSELAIVFNGGSEHRNDRVGMLIRGNVGQRQARGIIDRDMNEVPTDAAIAARAIARDAMPYTLDSPEFLDIQVQQLPGMFALVAPYGWAWFQIPPTRQPSSAKDPGHTGPGDSQTLAYEAPSAALLSQGNHLGPQLPGELARTATRPAGSIEQTRRTLSSIPAPPLLEGRQ